MQAAALSNMVSQPQLQVQPAVDQNNAEFNQLLQNILVSSRQYENCEMNLDENESQSDSNEPQEDPRESVSQPSSNDDEEAMDDDEDESESGSGESTAPSSTNNAQSIETLANALNGNVNKTSNPNLFAEIADIKSNIVFLNHQILTALKVDPCECDPCKTVTKKNSNKNTDDEVKQILGKILEANKPQKIDSTPPTPNVASNTDYEALLTQLVQQSQGNASMLSALNGQQLLALQNGLMKNRAPNPGGRKSKYCSPAEKKMVADYAQVHGASAAARKFNIPPPVAAYYHRKEYKQHHQPMQSQLVNNIPKIQPSVAQMISQSQSIPSSPIKLDNKLAGEVQHFKMPEIATNLYTQPQQQPTHPPQQQVSTPTSTTFNTSEMFQLESNPAHTGSPGFLRGRGRGRPKLIGDELDAELVEYMVQIKESDPRGHLTASQALVIARDYIMKKAPGLLEEHGGQVKLKLTWAMKLVSRIAERQREIQLGLPAGTLSNMTKGAGGLIGGGNLNTMTQNLLTEQMNNLINQLNNSTNTEQGGNGNVSMPQITNVRELKLEGMENGNQDEMVDQAELLKQLLANLKPEELNNFNENLMEAFRENPSE